MAINAFNLSKMVGENFEIYISGMARNTLNLPIIVGEKFEIYMSVKWLEIRAKARWRRNII